MEMLDEIVSTTVREDGIAQVETMYDQSELLERACQIFLTREREFQRLSARPDVVSDPKVNCAWWDSLERVYEAEKTVWKLFVGPQPTMADNRLYAKFRRLLLEGSKLRANA